MRSILKQKLVWTLCFAALLIGLSGVCSQAASLPFTYPKTVRVEYKPGLQNRVKLWIEVKNESVIYTKEYTDGCKKNFWNITSTKPSVASKPSKAIYNSLGTGLRFGPLVQLKKAGTTTMKYNVTINKKNYACKTKIYVYEYSNPLKSIKLDGTEIKKSAYCGMNASEIYCDGAYSSGKKHKIEIKPAKNWSVKKIVAKDYNKNKTVELTDGKSFSKKYDELVITMKNSKTKVEKTIDVMPY